jgi:hypothetical protein
MVDKFTVKTIEAAVGGPSTFALISDASAESVLASNSVVIQGAMLGALLTGATVVPETVGDSRVIRRLNAFERGNGPIVGLGKYRVNRIATQRTDGIDHLEAFIMREGDSTDTAYNVYDQLIQQVLIASFQQPKTPVGDIPLSIGFENGQLVSARLGMP